MLGYRQNPRWFGARDYSSRIHYILSLWDMEYTQGYKPKLSSNPLLQQFLEGHAVFCKLLDTFMKLVERHLFL